MNSGAHGRKLIGRYGHVRNDSKGRGGVVFKTGLRLERLPYSILKDSGNEVFQGAFRNLNLVKIGSNEDADDSICPMGVQNDVLLGLASGAIERTILMRSKNLLQAAPITCLGNMGSRLWAATRKTRTSNSVVRAAC